MGRRARPAETCLGAAIQERRGSLRVEDAAKHVGVSMHTLHRIERGTHKPSIGTAYKLARWLHRERRRDWGPWTLDRVIQSADMPAHMHRPLALERARQYAPDGAELGRTWFRGAANGWGWAFEFGEIVVFVDVGGCATMPMPDRIDWLGEVMAEPKANSDF